MKLLHMIFNVKEALVASLLSKFIIFFYLLLRNLNSHTLTHIPMSLAFKAAGGDNFTNREAFW